MRIFDSVFQENAQRYTELQNIQTGLCKVLKDKYGKFSHAKLKFGGGEVFYVIYDPINVQDNFYKANDETDDDGFTVSHIIQYSLYLTIILRWADPPSK